MPDCCSVEPTRGPFKCTCHSGERSLALELVAPFAVTPTLAGTMSRQVAHPDVRYLSGV